MNLRWTAIALFVTMFLASRASAQGTVTWADATYPKTGTMNGGILVKGTATPDAGYTLTLVAQVLIWPKNGGPQKSYTIAVAMNGTFGEFEVGAGDLTSGSDYNVLVQAGAKNACMVSFPISPLPRVATAK